MIADWQYSPIALLNFDDERTGPSLPTTLTALLDRAVARHPDGAAILYENDSLTYRAFDEQVRRAAGFLAAQGIGAGDRVAFWLPNTPAYLILYFACGRLGAVAVAVNTRFRAAEVGDIIRRSGARMLVLWPDFRGIDFPGILAALEPAALDAVESVIVYGEGADAAFELPGRAIHRFAEIGAHAPYDRDHAGPDTGSNIFTTSGTTSAPKLVLHRQSAVAVHTAEVARKFGFVDRIRCVCRCCRSAVCSGFARRSRPSRRRGRWC